MLFQSIVGLAGNILGWILFLPAALICIIIIIFKNRFKFLEGNRVKIPFHKSIVVGVLMAVLSIPLVIYLWDGGVEVFVSGFEIVPAFSDKILWLATAAQIFSVFLILIWEKSKPLLNSLVVCLITSLGITIVSMAVSTAFDGNIYSFRTLFLQCFNMGMVLSLPLLSANIIFRRMHG